MTVHEYLIILSIVWAIPCLSFLVWLHLHDKKKDNSKKPPGP